jgi:FMN-dependent NADH-azoreductase
MHLLNIQSSPREPRSASIAVADTFLQAYRRACPELTVDTLNVWQENLPDFDQHAIGAKYKRINKEPMDPAEETVWNRIKELVARFHRADRLVIGVPMWNFAYPYKLKQLIDLASQRNMLFTFDGRQYAPVLNIPRALMIYARGGTYAEDSPTPGPASIIRKATSISGCISSASGKSGRWWSRARRGAGRRRRRRASPAPRKRWGEWPRLSDFTICKVHLAGRRS